MQIQADLVDLLMIEGIGSLFAVSEVVSLR